MKLCTNSLEKAKSGTLGGWGGGGDGKKSKTSHHVKMVNVTEKVKCYVDSF